MAGQVVGAAVTQESATQLFTLGTRHNDEAGNRYIYLKNAASACTANYIYYYDPDTYTIISGGIETAADDGAAIPIVVAPLATTASYYGWFFCGPGRHQFTSEGVVAAVSGVRVSGTAGQISTDSADPLIHGVMCNDGIAASTTAGYCTASNEMYACDSYA